MIFKLSKPTPKTYLGTPPTSRISCVKLQSIFQISLRSQALQPWELVFVIAPGDDTPSVSFLDEAITSFFFNCNRKVLDPSAGMGVQRRILV
jgi:hypothetical protein